MTIGEMIAKNQVADGNIATRSLKNVVSGGNAEDFVQDGTICKIIDQSVKGFYNKRFGENAVFVVMERCDIDAQGKVNGTGEAVQVNLSMFDRVAAPYTTEGDGKVIRDKNKETVRACGNMIDAWKRAENAEKFMQDNKDKAFKVTLLDTVKVRAWDNAAKKFSDTETREQKVYKCEWV